MKDLEKRLRELKKDYDTVPLPEDGRERLKKAMNNVKEEHEMNTEKKNHSALLRRIGAVAAAAAILIALPNTGAGAAKAMGELPVVGGFFRAVTVRDFHYDEPGAHADVEVPQLETNTDSAAAGEVNAAAAKYADELTAQFRQAVAEYGEEANTDLNVSYDVVTDSEDYLTLRLSAEVVTASGAQFSRYYTIDKKADKVVQLSDVLTEAGRKAVSEDIKSQMRAQMTADENVEYFIDSDMPEEDFQQVREDENFHFDEEGNLIISFDEYEVAPGFMGEVDFTVARNVFEGELVK